MNLGTLLFTTSSMSPQVQGFTRLGERAAMIKCNQQFPTKISPGILSRMSGIGAIAFFCQGN